MQFEIESVASNGFGMTRDKAKLLVCCNSFESAPQDGCAYIVEYGAANWRAA